MNRSTKVSSSNKDPYKDGQPKITDFDKFLPWACNEFSIETVVVVARVSQASHVHIASDKTTGSNKQKISMLSTKANKYDDDIDDDLESEMDEDTVNDDDNTVNIRTVYDSNENLVQMKFLQNKGISRKIMQVIALAMPYHQFLNSININSGLSIETLYELAKFLPDSNVTELCLDGTFLPNAHYHILLTHGKLKYLSLARCSINDDILKTITDKLDVESPASKVLTALNLSTNYITDVGAKYVAEMLRSNRRLSYLNLAGNMISDEGGMSILDVLQTFLVNSQEFSKSRARYTEYLKKRYEQIRKNKTKFLSAKNKMSKKKSSYKPKLDSQSMNRLKKSIIETDNEFRTAKNDKVDNMFEHNIPLFEDPFSPHNIKTQDSVVHCFGNNTLCYLNFAYNNLTYTSVRKLRDVLLTQKSLNRTPKGLIRVVIEGNLMPVTCKEYEEINRLLGSIISRPHLISKTNMPLLKRSDIL